MNIKRPILVNTKPRPDLRRYGIQIPLLISRSASIINHLNQNVTVNKQFQRNQLLWNPSAIDWTLLSSTHTQDFIAQLQDPAGQEQAIMTCYELMDANGQPRRYDRSTAELPLRDLVKAQLEEASGTIEAARNASRHGFCYYLGGGMHHAMPHCGRGFCLVNDIVIAARYAQARQSGTVWVIDVDAHKGDGTAVCTKDDPSIKTLSVHMAKGWPLDEGETLFDGSSNLGHTPSDIDIPIASGEEAAYNSKLASGLDALRSSSNPILAIVVNGSDPYERDALPSTKPLQMTAEQLLQRDKLIYNFLSHLGIPQLWVMAGGYGEEVWRIHASFLADILSSVPSSD